MRTVGQSNSYTVILEKMVLITDYEELDVYLLAIELQQEIYELTRRFPNDERYSLTDQIRRSSRSIGANIAEA